MSTLSSRESNVVYGDSKAGFLVFLQGELAELYVALATSDTWGELKARIPSEEYENAFQGMRYGANGVENGVEPLPDEEFCYSDISDYASCDWPPYPLQKMLEWMPKEIQQQYGTVSGTMFDGDQLIIEPEQKAGVVKALEERGYICIEDDFVARVAARN